MITPLKDEGDPSSVVPGVIFGPAEYADKIRHITFDRPLNGRSESQKMEAIRRIAVSLDLPPEVLTGNGDVNHWTAWQIREETFQQHLQPFIELIVDGLTVAYLRQALERAGIEDPDKYMVWYDASSLVARPDKSLNAIKLHERLVISDQALRQVNSFNEGDAPNEDEYERRAALQLRVPGPVLGEEYDTQPSGGGAGLVPPSRVPTRDDDGTDDPGPANQPGPARSDRPGDGELAIKPGTVLAAGKDRELARELVDIDLRIMESIRQRADAALTNAFRRVGAVVRTRAKNDSTALASLNNIENHLAASVVGPAWVQALGIEEEEILLAELEPVVDDIDRDVEAAQEQALVAIAVFLGVALSRVRSIYGEQFSAARRRAKGVALTEMLSTAQSRLYNPGAAVTIVGEADELLLTSQSARRVVSTAGGEELSPEAGKGKDGIGTGPISNGILTDAGVLVEGYIWRYGFSRSQFQAHRQLNGTFYVTPQDEVLAIDSSDAWLGTPFYFPGDHKGCNCFAERVYRLEDDEA
jgi:hypothetical protein